MAYCDQDRSILTWLATQERVVRLWIEQAVASCADEDLVRRLETHQRWLSRQIDELRRDRAAACSGRRGRLT